jgi:hypothetical protein
MGNDYYVTNGAPGDGGRPDLGLGEVFGYDASRRSITTATRSGDAHPRPIWSRARTATRR